MAAADPITLQAGKRAIGRLDEAFRPALRHHRRHVLRLRTDGPTYTKV
jgi:hypothetical protein